MMSGPKVYWAMEPTGSQDGRPASRTGPDCWYGSSVRLYVAIGVHMQASPCQAKYLLAEGNQTLRRRPPSQEDITARSTSCAQSKRKGSKLERGRRLNVLYLIQARQKKGSLSDRKYASHKIISTGFS